MDMRGGYFKLRIADCRLQIGEDETTRIPSLPSALEWSYNGSMAVDLSVKGVPDALAGALRRRARRNHRSLQGELMAILEAAVSAGRTTGAVRESATAVAWTPLRATVAPRSEAALIIRAERDGRTVTIVDVFNELAAMGEGTPNESSAIIRKSRTTR
jgi:antitoxin FitA